jgi:hypothetical protein
MKLPKTITICGDKYAIKPCATSNGGSFDTFKRVITVGVLDPLKTHSIIIHEVVELVFAIRNIRYTKEVVSPDNGDYLFCFDHEQFNQAMEDVSAALKDIRL